MLLVSGVVFGAAFFVIKGLPNTYESRAVLVISRHQDGGAADSVRLRTAVEKLTSRPNLESLIHKNKLYAPMIERGALDDAVETMRRAIVVETKGRGEHPESIEISYRHNNPVMAQQVTSDLVSVLDVTNDTIERTMSAELAKVETDISRVEADLTVIGQKRVAERTSSVFALRQLDAATRVETERKTAAMSVGDLDDKQLLLERRIAAQQQQIEVQRKIVAATPPASAGVNGGSYGILAVRKAELEAQLKQFTEKYTDKNPQVIQTQKQLDEVNRQMADLKAATTSADGTTNSPEAAELRALERELSHMSAELEITKRELDRKKQALAALPAPSAQNPAAVASVTPGGMDPGTSQSDAEYDRLRIQYETLLSRRELLRRQSTVAAGVSPNFFSLIDPPNTPQFPVGPDRRRLMLLALALALAASLAIVAVLEFRRLPYVNDYRDVDYFLGVPVLAQIPESVTPVEHTRRRTLTLVRGLGVVLLAVVALPVLVILFTVLGVFQTLAK
jgi:succinoglycan biosynthesis transport protein ExoP